jgi:large subunit ribosomal protein L10
MTKEEKFLFVNELAETLRNNPNFFLLDISGYSVEKTNDLRRKCFENGYRLQTIKNKLFIKALQQLPTAHEELHSVLKESTTVMFVKEDPNAPAKLIKEFKSGAEKPHIKGAVVYDTVFTGDSTMEVLVSLKSKTQLLGEVIGMLQSPIQKVLGGLQGGGHKIAGLLETLSQRES